MVLPLQYTRDPLWILGSRSVDAVLRAQKLAEFYPKRLWYTGNCNGIRWRHAFAISPRPGGWPATQVQMHTKMLVEHPRRNFATLPFFST